MPGKDEWMLLTNLVFSVTHQLQSDEIDIVLIGPPGVCVIEVKHWTSKWVTSNKQLVEREAERVTDKARKIGTTLRRIVADLPFVRGLFLLTQEHSKVEQIAGKETRGIRFHTLKDWKNAIDLDSGAILSGQQIKTLSHALEPKCDVAIDGSLRRLAGYVNLELQTPREQQFHRIYKGTHTARQDRVILHLYDLSAANESKPATKAQREFEVLHRLQLYPWAPRILDSYQDALGYSGEMCFFTVVDPAAPPIEKRVGDTSWSTEERLNFALRTIGALKELHEAGSNEQPMIHRNLNTKNILVKHDNSPILTGFGYAKIQASSNTIFEVSTGEQNSSFAPEVRVQGFGRADHRSDVYSLCYCLTSLFETNEDSMSQQAVKILTRGLTREPEERTTLENLENSFASLLGEPSSSSAVPSAQFWTEDQEVPFGNHTYRIIARLGTGGIGIAFKVVQISHSTKEDLGTYVAKVAHDPTIGERILKSYGLARSHLARHPALSTIFEVAPKWQENDFVALMTWIEGSALESFTGVLSLLAEDQQEVSAEALALRWLRTMCEALGVLHQNGLIHGDVSPRNMIVSGNDLVLTDYDFVTEIGEPITFSGTALYCPPSNENHKASVSNDIYALAASFFHVVFEKEPFRRGGVISKERGLNWEGINREDYPTLAGFLDKATDPDPEMRFESVVQALTEIVTAKAKTEDNEGKTPRGESIAALAGETEKTERTTRGKNQVKWLRSLLQSYPGSRWGNTETRGLDSDFARRTYVPTELEELLYNDIIKRKVRLVLLCGNAGDGKTALLQSLAARLDQDNRSSSERIIETKTSDGLLIRMNLDGSAAQREHSADDLLDEFLEPFQLGEPDEDIAHLLAINDGRLLEWIERADHTPLTDDLTELLKDQTISKKSYIRFVDLNQRSLVGGIGEKQNQVDIGFLEKLLDKLYGGDEAARIWEPCRTCLAQNRCEVFRAMRVFGPETAAGSEPEKVRSRARKRLFEALQSVHLRGETHVTVRELRAALVYILFGVHFCDDYHKNPEDISFPTYWDRSFSPDSPDRQGELLAELVKFDPALEAHPKIDRHLTRSPSPYSEYTAPHYAQLKRESARRRAYFEWTEHNIEEIGGESHALALAQGRYLHHFRNLPLKDQGDLADLCKRLCRGISRLQDLPPQAFERRDAVPLRITPRTPTETAFWVEKELASFRLEADIPNGEDKLSRLHRHAFLTYSYHDGREEKLRMGAELFHLLLELGEGYQLGDVSTDDTFAHLSIFVQRLVSEDERRMFAHNPMLEEDIHEISVITERNGKDTVAQPIKISVVGQGDWR